MSSDAFQPIPQPGEVTTDIAPVNWQELDETATSEALRTLTPWVHWIVHRYQLDTRTIPTCWQHHGAIVEELSALRTGWSHAYLADSYGRPALDWHTAFHHARQRLTDWTARTGCRHEHRSQVES